MQIIHIVPGSGGSFYCGNCLRDSKYINELNSVGVEVVKVPLYLPLFADEHDLEDVPVFYGAISIYMKHMFPFFRKAPAWFDRLLNSGPALRLAARMAGSTNAKGLEDMTISMLEGEHGEQKEELGKLIKWIKEHSNPDIIHISNALLLGLVKQIKEQLDVTVVCTLQDEDVWVNAMDEKYKIKTWELMKEKSCDVDAFFAVSDYFANKMQLLLDIPVEKMFTHHISIAPEDYHISPERPLNIGYISRMCESNGLDVLVDAFILLMKDPKWKDLNLVITGGSTDEDNQFIEDIKRKIYNEGIKESVDFHQNFEEEGRHEFFRKISLLSVPVLEGEAFGLYLLESMASGVPVVQPALGAFPEIIEKSRGGIVYHPNTPEELSNTLAELLSDPKKISMLSKAGIEGVNNKFNIHEQAVEIIEFYNRIRNKNNMDKNAAQT